MVSSFPYQKQVQNLLGSVILIGAEDLILKEDLLLDIYSILGVQQLVGAAENKQLLLSVLHR